MAGRMLQDSLIKKEQIKSGAWIKVKTCSYKVRTKREVFDKEGIIAIFVASNAEHN